MTAYRLPCFFSHGGYLAIVAYREYLIGGEGIGVEEIEFFAFGHKGSKVFLCHKNSI